MVGAAARMTHLGGLSPLDRPLRREHCGTSQGCC